MTAAKNVYALMLALIIVLSGCFGNTTEPVDADENDDQTTIINHYYYNNTTTTIVEETPEMIAIGGHLELGPGNWSSVARIQTGIGQLVKIEEIAIAGDDGGALLEITTMCGDENGDMIANDMVFWPVEMIVDRYGNLDNDTRLPTGNYLPGSVDFCSHAIGVIALGDDWTDNNVTISWSLAYSITSVTIGQSHLYTN